MFTRIATLALAASLAAVAPALADITIEDAYARASSPKAKSGAAFMTITNTAPTADRLIAAASDAAMRVELHTHIEDANGVMRMIEVEDGVPVPAESSHRLMRGGDHVMFMGLTRPFIDGDSVTVTLTFELAGDVTVDIPVDNARKPGPMAHGKMN